jgi:hypothetical protein
MPLDGQFNRQINRRPHTAGVGLVSSDNVECRAVIGAGAHDRQAERYIHRLIESQ